MSGLDALGWGGGIALLCVGLKILSVSFEVTYTKKLDTPKPPESQKPAHPRGDQHRGLTP